jgi:hypothetical protein
VKRDIAIVICSRGREDLLSRLLDDIDGAFAPAIEAGGLSLCTFVYAQNYPRAYLDALSQRFAAAIKQGKLILCEQTHTHSRIGDVFSSAIAALHARVEYRLAMLMDDDSLYRSEPQVDANLVQAAQDFLTHRDRAYSIKLGQSRTLEYWPFINAAGPIMPFKEKMLWVSRAVMEDALAFPDFAKLSVGEDVVLAALAWRGDAQRCYGVFGIASFLHLAFEADEEAETLPMSGGYGELMGYLEGQDDQSGLGKYAVAYHAGTVPAHILPEIFVGQEHPHFVISGIRPEAVERYGASDTQFHQVNRFG